MGEVDRGPGTRWVSSLAILAILALGGYLRAKYLLSSSPFVDEYITMEAARKILERGAPILESGNLYTHGLLFSYLDAGFMALLSFTPIAARLPSLLASLLAIFVTFRLGNRAFSSVVGVLAALSLALDPEAVIWGGRARMYALLQLEIAALVYFLYRSEVGNEENASRYLMALCFLAAIFSQAVALLLLPFILLTVLLARGWRHFLKPHVAAAYGLCVAGAAGRWLLDAMWNIPAMTRVGEGQFAPRSREFLSPGLDLAGAGKILAPFAAPPYILWSALFVLGGIFLTWHLLRSRGRRPTSGPLPYAYVPGLKILYVLFLGPLLVLLFLVGSTWKSPRYLFMVMPLFSLIGATWLVTGLGRLTARHGKSKPISGAAVRFATGVAGAVLVIALFLPSALAASERPGFGYDRAFEYVKESRRNGDMVMTINCPAASFHLGRCDYLAIEEGFEGYVVRRGDSWVEGWALVPILDSASQLDRVLSGERRIWFVVDEGRFRQRYTPFFVQRVWDQMDLVFRERGVMVFLSRDAEVPAVGESVQVNFEDRISLVGYDLGRPQESAEPGWGNAVVSPGQSLPLILYWQSLAPTQESYVSFIHLTNKYGESAGGKDAPPMRGLHPTNLWLPGETLPDHWEIPTLADAPSGRYRVTMGLYKPDTSERLRVLNFNGDPIGEEVTLDFIALRRPGDTIPTPGHPVDVTLGNTIELVGIDAEQPTDDSSLSAIQITLHWQAIGAVADDYTVFVHLLGPDGAILAQGDAPPLDGFYPTSFWDPGERVIDQHLVPVEDVIIPEGARIALGMYLPQTGERLPAVGEFSSEDRLVLPLVALLAE